jgi:hypothetical protein
MDSPHFINSNALLISASGILRYPIVVMSYRASRTAQIGIAAGDMIGHSGRK